MRAARQLAGQPALFVANPVLTLPQRLPRDAAGPVHAAGADDPRCKNHRARHDNYGARHDDPSDGTRRDDDTPRAGTTGPIDAASAHGSTRVRCDQSEGPSEKGRGDQEQPHGDSPCIVSPSATPREPAHGQSVTISPQGADMKTVFQSRFMSTTVQPPAVAPSSPFSRRPMPGWRGKGPSPPPPGGVGVGGEKRP